MGSFLGWSFGEDSVVWSVKRADLLGDLESGDLIVKSLSMFEEDGKEILLNI